jgi:hypothetical protein
MRACWKVDMRAAFDAESERDRLAAQVERVEALCNIADQRSKNSLSRNIFGEPFAGLVKSDEILAALAVPAAEETTTDE